MKPLIHIISITFMSLLFGCDQSVFVDENTSPAADPGVDSRLIPLFELFEYEARIRGYQFDLQELGITGVIDQIAENGVAGTCQYGNHIAHVTVDESYWYNSTAARREMVVFHELGHCVLHRGHTEFSFSNGLCQSIMNSGTSGCHVAYNNTNRQYYLNELFDNLQFQLAINDK